MHAEPATQSTQVPALHTLLAPQPVPSALFAPSWQTTAPVLHATVPLRQAFGFVEQLAPGVQEIQLPVGLQTWFVPQLVPAATFAPWSTQTEVPLPQLVRPVWHLLVGVHATPAVQSPQTPAPLQTLLVPQDVPADLFAPSWQTSPPVPQAITPSLQAAFGFVEQLAPAAQEMQVPVGLQTWFVPQLVPAARFVF